MGYRELAVPVPRPTIDISGVRYDIDYFGMDDGERDAPDDALRFVFQLGRHLMIHLYVIQAGGESSVGHFAHSFWNWDCAVAHVDRKKLGAPDRVDVSSIALPVVYDSVALVDRTRREQPVDRMRREQPVDRTRRVAPVDGQEQRFEVRTQRFRARHDAGKQHLEMTFELAQEGQAAGRLLWSCEGGWAYHPEVGSVRRLVEGQWLRFACSAPDRPPVA